MIEDNLFFKNENADASETKNLFSSGKKSKPRKVSAKKYLIEGASSNRDVFQNSNIGNVAVDIGLKPRVYTVTEITRRARVLMEEAFPAVWISGEVSNYKSHSSGHLYFSLKDDTSILKCVFFRSANARLKFDLNDGMLVLCFGRISVYEKQGQYQLYVEAIEPLGAGALSLAFEKLKNDLRKEGLFDENHKKKIPFLPKKIGIVTSITGAAIRDILQILFRRFHNVHVVIYPVKVQGEGSENEIASAIAALNEYNKYFIEKFTREDVIDVMIVARGGGSLEDLWAFNMEEVARAVFASHIPVISAVGHEIDFTICDFVSDLRAPTPSAAAELVVSEKNILLENISAIEKRLDSILFKHIASLDDKVRSLSESYVMRAPCNTILQRLQEIDDFEKKMKISISHFYEVKKTGMERLFDKLEVLSPRNILNRGYSITFKEGKVVKKFEEIKKGDRLVTALSRGSVESTADKMSLGKDNI
ncbi:exodeoxyribonuclease VII large subunit [Candidatus Omnitrophus magneticus]|uniref:Exodeoxyribonuclease 7 large subunit n=1 Tax=Candidatus Omnitrophus magneticus TaxID=1609969 RepID=A0A0F0CTI7_9BACT|nr:exodeoxyribonuclease VII large subunit [Candidatus Omnitrophus magneticus]